MRHHLTMLAYEMNGAPPSYGHGAPLRLRNEDQLGFRQVKWLAGIEFVEHYARVGGGHGGYNPDHEFFGYRQSLWPGRTLRVAAWTGWRAARLRYTRPER